MTSGLSRRRFLAGMGTVGLAAWAGPSLGRLARASTVADPDSRTGFAFGVASFDPTHESVLLWTRQDDPSAPAPLVRVVAGDFATGTEVVPWSVATQFDGVPRGDGTVAVDVAQLMAGVGASAALAPGTTLTYAFGSADGTKHSAVGTTRTLGLDRLRLAVASCQDWQLGRYAAWRDIARTDLDAVIFLGDYIYEYGSYGVGETYTHADGSTRPTTHGRTHVVRPHRSAAVDTSGAVLLGTTSVPETETVDEYRDRYRLYRSDPLLRAAHRSHPFIAVWDDHEVTGDRYADGAVNHGDDENGDPREDPTSDLYVPYSEREANGVVAYEEYLPGRLSTVDGKRTTFRTLRVGDLAELTMLDSRTFRDRNASDASNRNFNPANNIDVPKISAEGRTILGATQKQWLKETWRNAEADGVRWKLVGNQLMMSPLNLVSLPDIIGADVERITKDEGAALPFTYHRDGIPVNIDQWDGYQAERRELLTFLRHGTDGHTGAGEHDLKQVHDVVPGASGIRDVVFMTGDIHIHWSMEVHVDWGDAAFDDPVAAEFVGAGISSENFNERIGDLSIKRPLPHGASGHWSRAAIATNPHLRYTDFDSNGWIYMDIDADRVHAEHRVLVDAPQSNPVENDNAAVITAAGASWQVVPGLSRLIPDTPQLGIG